MSVLTGKKSTDCIENGNLKDNKNAFSIQQKTNQELLECISVNPKLRCINQDYQYHASSDVQLNDKKTFKFTKVLMKSTMIKGCKMGPIMYKGEVCNKAYQMENAFMELFLSSPCPMVLIAADTQKVIKVNDNFMMLAGQDRGTILQWRVNRLREMISPEDFNNIRNSLRYHQSVENYECKFNVKSKNGSMALLNIKYLIWKEQKMILVTVVDISETIELKNQIERLSCLNLVGQLAASIGHEIRNPMTTVRGYLRFMQRKPTFGEYTEQFSMMIRELDRANEIITDFLALAKNRVNGLAIQNINEIIEDIAPLMEAMASEIGHSIEFALQLVPNILVDKIDIHKALINLVKNGFEAMDSKGKVIVRTYKEENSIVLQVVDEGKGIPIEIVEKLGTPFFTTKEKGTGLGLSVCYQIAARHNALLDIKTSTAGSTFSLRFPYQDSVEKI